MGTEALNVAKVQGNWGRKEDNPAPLYFMVVIFLLCTVVSVVAAKKYLLSAPSQTQPRQSIPPVASSDSTNQPESEEEQQRQEIEAIVQGMTLEQKVGLLFMVRDNADSPFTDIVSNTHAGGVVLFAEDFKGKTADQVREMIDQLQNASDGKMLVAVDEEGGTVVRVSRNTRLRSSRFQSPQALFKAGGYELIESDTREKCELLHSLHINMNLAPVADVCEKSSGFIYQRSFGKDAQATSEYVTTVVRTMNEYPVASCVKHFPGYGDSEGDTHEKLVVNEKTLDELFSRDLIPFVNAIRYGADAIMLTHTVIKEVDSETPGSLSPDVVSLMRETMGFEGVIISDGLEMGAINEYSGGDSGKVCVLAVNAGVDILCAPKNPLKDYQTVLSAVQSGEIAESRVDESVMRIVKLKMRLGLYKNT